MIQQYKYSKTDRNKYLIRAIITLLIFAMNYYLFYFSEYETLLFNILDAILPFLFALFLSLFFDSIIYLSAVKRNRSAIIENNYKSNIRTITILTLSLFIVVISYDLKFLFKWQQYGEEDATGGFWILFVFHLILFITVYCIFNKGEKSKYPSRRDETTHTHIHDQTYERIGFAIICSIIPLLSIEVMDELTHYIHIDHNNAYGDSMDFFKDRATLTITSNDLQDGIWSPEIISSDTHIGVSPHIYFESVNGADHYVVCMIDETVGYTSLWLATEIRENELFTGDNLEAHINDPYYRYSGLLCPLVEAETERDISVYVFALKGEPRNDVSDFYPNNRTFISIPPNELYADFLSPVAKEQDFKPNFHIVSNNFYGNVISYGYITGKYIPQ